MVTDMISMQAENIKNHFLKGEYRTAQNFARLEGILEDYAKTIGEQFDTVIDELKPLDDSISGWENQNGSETFRIMNEKLEIFSDGKFLSEKLSDILGGEPSDWLDAEKESLLKVVALRMFQFVSAVAYCSKYGIDPNRLLQR